MINYVISEEKCREVIVNLVKEGEDIKLNINNVTVCTLNGIDGNLVKNVINGKELRILSEAGVELTYFSTTGDINHYHIESKYEHPIESKYEHPR